MEREGGKNHEIKWRGDFPWSIMMLYQELGSMIHSVWDPQSHNIMFK